MFDVTVVGGGASGMMAAITAAQSGAHVGVLEKNGRICRKVYITGKGRCNITNNCDTQTCLANTVTNGKFLFSAMQAFPPEKTIAFFEELGCPLKTERGNRVFPVSDQATDVIDALERRRKALGIELISANARELQIENGAVTGVITDRDAITAPRVILALGGASYPRTGSTGDGYKLATQAGHTVIEPTGSLVPLVAETFGMNGLTLRNVGVRLVRNKKAIYEDFGEVTFTEVGLEGPTILSCSANMGRDSGFTVILDLKPALTEQQLDNRIQRDLKAFGAAPMEAALTKLLPRQIILPLLRLADVSPTMPASELPKAQRLAVVHTCKALPFPILGKRPIDEAIVTSGGVNVREIDPKTMQSKIVQGLYFAGELIDVDAYTGGFNLQIAWATGYAAGLAASHRELRDMP